MKIGIVSDTHGSIGNVVTAFKGIKNLNLIIHLGDYIFDAMEIEKKLGVKTIFVRGNCDYLNTDADYEKTIEIKGKKIFMTHGHKYNVKMRVSNIFYRGKEENADVILFGHSHMSTKILHEDILILNPGSPKEPRSGSKESIALIEISEEEIIGEIIFL